MLESPFAVIFIVVILGMAAIRQYNEICSFGDLFNGKAFSWSHHTEHVNREFTGFFYVLAFAVFAGFVCLIGNCLSEGGFAQKRVFISDLVSPKEMAKSASKSKVQTVNHPPKTHHTVSHVVAGHKVQIHALAEHEKSKNAPANHSKHDH